LKAIYDRPFLFKIYRGIAKHLFGSACFVFGPKYFYTSLTFFTVRHFTASASFLFSYKIKVEQYFVLPHFGVSFCAVFLGNYFFSFVENI